MWWCPKIEKYEVWSSGSCEFGLVDGAGRFRGSFMCQNQEKSTVIFFFVSVHVPDTSSSEGSFAILVMFIPLSSSSILYIRCISCLASAQDQTKPFSNGWKFPPSLSQTYQFVWGNQTWFWFMLRITKSMSQVLPRQLALWHRTRNRHPPCLRDERGRQPTIWWGISLYI